MSAGDRQEDWSGFLTGLQFCFSPSIHHDSLILLLNWKGEKMEGMPTSITSPFPNPLPEHHELLSLVLEGGSWVLGWCEEQRRECEPLICVSYLSLFQGVVALLEEEFSESWKIVESSSMGASLPPTPTFLSSVSFLSPLLFSSLRLKANMYRLLWLSIKELSPVLLPILGKISYNI